MKDDPAVDQRREAIAMIAARLSRVRGQMSDAEFARLLADVVRTAERFIEIDARPDARMPVDAAL